ncbi:MAG TPA: DsbA family protein [Gammaproteobacteria bacterium]
MAVLHYLYDPLCGWCYGAEPLVRAARAVDGLDVCLRAGGLWPVPTSLPDEMRRYIREADARVAALSGQPYGAAYLDGLLLDPDLVLHSPPVIAAVLAAEALEPGRGFDMVCGIQHAHYEEGRHVVRHDVLCDIAERLGFDRDAFEAAAARAPVDEHVAETRRLMSAVGARGFPTFVLDVEGRRFTVPHHRFASSPPAFAAWLREEIDRLSGLPLRA